MIAVNVTTTIDAQIIIIAENSIGSERRLIVGERREIGFRLIPVTLVDN